MENSLRHCPECGVEIDRDERDEKWAVVVGDQWWHRECMDANTEYDEYRTSLAAEPE